MLIFRGVKETEVQTFFFWSQNSKTAKFLLVKKAPKSCLYKTCWFHGGWILQILGVDSLAKIVCKYILYTIRSMGLVCLPLLIYHNHQPLMTEHIPFVPWFLKNMNISMSGMSGWWSTRLDHCQHPLTTRMSQEVSKWGYKVITYLSMVYIGVITYWSILILTFDP